MGTQIIMTMPKTSLGNRENLGIVDDSDYDWHVEGNRWIDKTGKVKWSENDSFDGDIEKVTLTPGTKIDRYGSELGKFVAPKGTPYQNRSLRPGSVNTQYNVYEVIKPLKVEKGKTAPWFGEPGGGVQYKLPSSVNDLLKQGIIKKYKEK